LTRVLGIDPGSHVTGWALVAEEGSARRCERSGEIRLGEGELAQRLTKLHSELRALLSELSPDCVAVESAFHARSAKSALVLGHARGVVMLAVGQAGLPALEYAPREVKMAVAGNGSATKDQVQFMVRRLLALRAAPGADAADAMALGLCHLHRSRLHLPKSRSRRAAAEAALWRAKARR